jgi:RHS repeat-associated protein
MVMPGRMIRNGQAYRYGYQGEFAETDEETGKPAFQLRIYDPRINRWLSPDPMGQYHSPYMSMDNRWNMSIDPTGGCTEEGCTHDAHGGSLPGFSLTLKGGGGFSGSGIDMNMYGRAGNMWGDVDWQEVYKPEIDEMRASISAARRPMEEVIIETAMWLAPVPKIGLLGKGFNFLNKRLATKYLSKIGQLQNFEKVYGFSIALNKRIYKYHTSFAHASRTPWSSPALFKTQGSAFNRLGLDYSKSTNFAGLRFQTRQFGVFVNGTAKAQGMTFGTGAQSLKSYGFYTKPILSPW